jgi:hypothetical protein
MGPVAGDVDVDVVDLGGRMLVDLGAGVVHIGPKK